MSGIQAYDIKARKKVSMRNPQPYLMKNGSWALKGTSAETGIKLFKIVQDMDVNNVHTMKYIKLITTLMDCKNLIALI